MLHIVIFWFVKGPKFIFDKFVSTISSFEGHLALRATASNLTKPLFQDYTWQGRIIGFFFRIGRIGLGLLLYTVLTACFILAALLWIAFPFACLISLIGSVVGPSYNMP